MNLLLKESSDSVERKTKCTFYIADLTQIIQDIKNKTQHFTLTQAVLKLPTPMLGSSFPMHIMETWKLQLHSIKCNKNHCYYPWKNWSAALYLSFSSCSNWSNFSRTGCKNSFKSCLICNVSWCRRSFSSLNVTSIYKFLIKRAQQKRRCRYVISCPQIQVGKVEA